MSLIELTHLSKQFQILNRQEGLGGAIRDLFSTDYRLVKAVEEIPFTIEAGEIVGCIGPDGAGKSTTIKMMTGILKPTSGQVRVNGLAPYDHRQRNARNMGVIFDWFFRFLFTYLVPIGLMAFYPAQLFLRPESVPALAYAAPLVGLGTFAVAYCVWTKGVNYYAGTGS